MIIGLGFLSGVFIAGYIAGALVVYMTSGK